MLDFSIIGCGAAGNKAVAQLVAKGYSKDKCYYVNSTSVDLPAECDKEHTIIFGAQSKLTFGGCGKERSIGKRMIIEDMRSDTSAFDKICGNEHAIVLCGSTEGGSGSASLPILAKYFHEVHHKPVIVILFFGFKDDVRGLQNSIEICQELSEDYGIVGIDNAGFLDDNNGNRFKAEQAANEQFCKVIKILSGGVINNGQQVIDDTDLYKVVTTPGYMIADGTKLPDRIKTVEAYTNTLNNFLLNNAAYIDPPKGSGCRRIAAIFNLREIDDNINYSADAVSAIYGQPYEYFISTGGMIDNCNSFYFIASGMKFPIDRIQGIFDEYKARSESVDKSKDSFFGHVNELRGAIEDAQFNMLGGSQQDEAQTTAAKKDFFGSLGISDFSGTGGKTFATGMISQETDEY